jgi:hypothetical protein
MRESSNSTAIRIVLLGALGVGWLAGLVGQRAVIEATGYADIMPPLMLLGISLCALAGAVARVLAPRRRRRAGAVAGLAMMVSMVGGYILLGVAYADRFAGRESGETWYTLLLEAWFWIGVPVVLSSALGVLGWSAVDVVLRLTGRAARPG